MRFAWVAADGFASPTAPVAAAGLADDLGDVAVDGVTSPTAPGLAGFGDVSEDLEPPGSPSAFVEGLGLSGRADLLSGSLPDTWLSAVSPVASPLAGADPLSDPSLPSAPGALVLTPCWTALV